MPIDPQRLARVRAHLLTAAALVTAGCGANPPEHTINEPVHVNTPPTTTATPSATPTPDGPAPDVNTPPTGRTPVKAPPDKQPDPIHVNTPRPPG